VRADLEAALAGVPAPAPVPDPPVGRPPLAAVAERAAEIPKTTIEEE
jgi:hypothetical protein